MKAIKPLLQIDIFTNSSSESHTFSSNRKISKNVVLYDIKGRRIVSQVHRGNNVDSETSEYKAGNSFLSVRVNK